MTTVANRLTDDEYLRVAIQHIAESQRFREVLDALDTLITPRPDGALGADGQPLAPFPPVLTDDDGDATEDLIGPFVFALRRWVEAAAEMCDPPLAELGHADGAQWRSRNPGTVLRIGPIIAAWLGRATADDDEAKLRDALEGDDFRTFAYGFSYSAGGPMSPTVAGFLRDDAQPQKLSATG